MYPIFYFSYSCLYKRLLRRKFLWISVLKIPYKLLKAKNANETVFIPFYSCVPCSIPLTPSFFTSKCFNFCIISDFSVPARGSEPLLLSVYIFCGGWYRLWALVHTSPCVQETIPFLPNAPHRIQLLI